MKPGVHFLNNGQYEYPDEAARKKYHIHLDSYPYDVLKSH